MNFDFKWETFTNWLMSLITGKAKSSATELSGTMTGFAEFLTAMGVSGGPVELVQSGAATVTAAANKLTEIGPELAAEAATAAKAAAAELAKRNANGTQVALAPPAPPAAPTGQRPPASTERAPA